MHREFIIIKSEPLIFTLYPSKELLMMGCLSHKCHRYCWQASSGQWFGNEWSDLLYDESSVLNNSFCKRNRRELSTDQLRFTFKKFQCRSDPLFLLSICIKAHMKISSVIFHPNSNFAYLTLYVSYPSQALYQLYSNGHS
jgi:hypothetical protein